MLFIAIILGRMKFLERWPRSKGLSDPLTLQLTPAFPTESKQGLKTPGILGTISTTKITTAQRSSSQRRVQCYLQVQCAQKRGGKNQIIPHLWSQSEPCGESASWFDPP